MSRPPRPALLVMTLAAAVLPAVARVDVTLDAGSLNELLANMAPDHVDVALAAGKTVRIELHDLKVTGFDPSAGPNGGVLTAVRVRVPELSLDLPVEPRLSVQMQDGPNGTRACHLKFEKVVLALPLTGSVDVASLLPVLPVMPETSWMVDSARGRVRVTPKLTDARTGAKNLKLGFELDVTAAQERAAR